MKRFLLSFFSFCFFTLGYAQTNLSLVSNLQFNDDASDVWGYVAPDGTEYAIVGLNNSTVVVSLADPANPVIRETIPGTSSIWRDMKAWGEYVYVTTDSGNDGLLIIDMTNHDTADPLNHVFYKPMLNVNGSVGLLTRAHNIYIDENGVAYIAGSNLNNGGNIFFDVTQNPLAPDFLGGSDPIYSHDVYVRGDTMWSSDINDGFFSVTDVTDKANPQLLATQTTPFFFSHNAWLSDDGNTLFTTDEVGNAPIGSYDVSDLDNIQLLDEFRPLATIGEGVIPHNVHVLGDYLVISYYTDGVVVVDATEPDILVEVGNYDTFNGPSGGFNGSWGAYPFLPSGLILASDIQTGLYVLQPNFTRASYLRGLVTDASTTDPIFDAEITVEGGAAFTATDFNGNYKTGLSPDGTFNVTVSHPLYEDQTVSVTFVEGQTIIQDFQLVPLVPFAFSGQLIDANTLAPVENGVVKIENETFSFDLTTDGSGNFDVPQFLAGEYNVYGGKWGFQTVELSSQDLNEVNNTILIEIEEGFVDGFELDLGWTVSGDATSGFWEKGVPTGNTGVPFPLLPSLDNPNDIGDEAYITGNGPDVFDPNNSVNGGTTVLTSPQFDLTNFVDPVILFDVWFFNIIIPEGPNLPNPGDDMVSVVLDNGIEQVVALDIPAVDIFSLGWEEYSINVTDFLPLTANMSISFEVNNVTPFPPGNIADAAIDFFRVEEGAVSISEVFGEDFTLQAFPNPSADKFTIDYQFDVQDSSTRLSVYNALGMLVDQVELDQNEGRIDLGQDLQSGVYFIRLENAEGQTNSLKVVKMR